MFYQFKKKKILTYPYYIWQFLFVVMSLSLGISLNTQVQSATVKPLSLKGLVSLSSEIFQGRVIDQVVKETSSQVWTQTTFEIVEGWKGTLKKGHRWTLTQPGGEVGEGLTYKRVYIPGHPQFTLNEDVVLFIEKAPAGNLVVAGLTQGKYTLEMTSKGQYARRFLKGVHLYQARPQHEIKTFAHLPQDLNFLPLSSLKALVLNQSKPRSFSASERKLTPVLRIQPPRYDSSSTSILPPKAKVIP